MDYSDAIEAINDEMRKSILRAVDSTNQTDYEEWVLRGAAMACASDFLTEKQRENANAD